MGAVMDQPLSLYEAEQLLSRHGFVFERKRGHKVYCHPDHPDLLIALNNGLDRSGARDVRRAIALAEARAQGKNPVVPRRASRKMLPFDGEEEFFLAAEQRQQEVRLSRAAANVRLARRTRTLVADLGQHLVDDATALKARFAASGPIAPPALAPEPAPSPDPVEVPVSVIPTALAEAANRPATEEYIIVLDAGQRDALAEIQRTLTRRAQEATLGLGVVEVSADRVLQLAVTRGLAVLAAEVRA